MLKNAITCKKIEIYLQNRAWYPEISPESAFIEKMKNFDVALII